MKSNLEIFKIWAPDESPWSQWAKPVLFTNLVQQELALTLYQPTWQSTYDQETMIILDLPNYDAVPEALALAKLGYRPVPLYNGALNDGEADWTKKNYKIEMVVNPGEISRALYSGSEILENLTIPATAAPVFMLDANRFPQKMSSGAVYDNRWVVFPQDFPSASFLLAQGIKQIIVKTDHENNDLLHILYRYREKGLAVYRCNRNLKIKEYLLAVPISFRKAKYRVNSLIGLASNSTGGFGRRNVISDGSYRGG